MALCDWLKDYSGVIESLTVAAASLIAIIGVSAWRAEMVGRRRAEVAESALAHFYEARDIIQEARNPFYGSEGQTRPRAPGEAESQAGLLDSYYAPAERLFKKNEFFAQFLASRYSFMAVFGRKSAEPFDTTLRSRNSVFIASQMLIRSTRDRDYEHAPNEEARQQAVKRRQEWESEIWSVGDASDTIQANMNAAVAAMESFCRPVIEGRYRSRWRDLRKRIGELLNPR